MTNYIEDLDDECRDQQCGPEDEISMRPSCHPRWGFQVVYKQAEGALGFLCALCGAERVPRVAIARDPRRAN